ncbi:hypothetical protein G7Z17_g3902 [Cylindrodendrum hubeiense]|uniref:Heterokaryon incompatibility domain-containing protein n=1 Tax=Cylindrodendrum hubeiense TaxID=595255 RepID=A0A9P5HK43_9HYPO|nr:hypothetical protein G7Z17_g3902 [Cylindrodendrum hubeiense]
MSSEALEALLAAAALEPPTGVTANFDDPPNQNGLAWAVTTFCMVVATLCLLLRAYARLWLERKVSVEEVLMILAYGAYWGTAYAAYALIWTPGYYVHTWNLHNKDLIQPLYLILIYGCCYTAVLPIIKTAILLDWCRVFVPVDRYKSAFWWGCMIVIAIQCIWGVVCIVLLNMQCVPHNAIWEFYVPSKCYSLPKVMLSSASVQVITDFAIVLLPQKIIWGLHMNWQKKLGVSVIFGVGIVALIAACFRLAHTVTFAKTTDSMYFIGPLLFWACAEMTCGFFILSMPCLPKIIAESGLPRKLKDALGISFKSSSASNPNSKYGHRSGSRQLSKSGITSDSYYNIEENATPMGNLDRPESQEHLREAHHIRDAKKSVHVTRTTQITVTSNSPSGSDVDDNTTPWHSYEALSYAWSQGPPDKTIKVNGQQVSVGANLHNALQTLRLTSRRTLWVDAICINLADMDERNNQANMMPYIYSRAEKVLAWLGPARQRFTEDELNDMKSPKSRCYMVWSDANCIAVAESPYWSRRWTIQELVMAKDINFHLGIGFFTIDEYVNLLVGDELMPVRQRLELIQATRKKQGSDIQRLEVLLETYSDLVCHETRDKVFSLLGMADDTAQLMVEVDYNANYFNMYTNLIEYHHASSPLPHRPSCFSRDFDSGPWSDKNRLVKFANEIERSVRLVSFSHLVQKTLEGSVDESRSTIGTSSTTSEGTYVARGAFAGKILHLGPTYNELVSSWKANKQWNAAIEDEYKMDPKLVEMRRASAEYSRAILSWDENHIRAIRIVDSLASYGYQNSANDEFIDPQGLTQSAEWSEPRQFLATNGLMGFVPPQAKAGDLIYSFWECTVGFVVRKVAHDRWVIVARADLSRETLPGILDMDYFTNALNYVAEDEVSSRRKGPDYYQKARREAFENVLNFKLDINTLQQLTA